MMDRKGYEQIPIPEELDEVVQGAIAQGLSRRRKHGAEYDDQIMGKRIHPADVRYFIFRHEFSHRDR